MAMQPRHKAARFLTHQSACLDIKSKPDNCREVVGEESSSHHITFLTIGQRECSHLAVQVADGVAMHSNNVLGTPSQLLEDELENNVLYVSGSGTLITSQLNIKLLS